MQVASPRLPATPLTVCVSNVDEHALSSAAKSLRQNRLQNRFSSLGIAGDCCLPLINPMLVSRPIMTGNASGSLFALFLLVEYWRTLAMKH